MPPLVNPARLSHYQVQCAQLQCTEYQFRIAVDFTVRIRDNPATPDIIVLLTALSNSAGGVVSLSCQGVCDDKVIRNWMVQFENTLKGLYPHDRLDKNFKIDYEQTDEKIMWVHILMKKSVQLIICDYGLHERSGTENIKVVNIESAAKLIKAKSGNFQEKQCSSIEWNAPVSDMNENSTTEFRYWKTAGVSDMTEHLKNKSLESSLFAFLNNPEGGTVLIGVEENKVQKKNIVTGQKLSENEEPTLITAIEHILSDDQTGQKRIWGNTDQAPARGTYWDVKIDEVVNCPDDEPRRVVIRILLKHYPGGVFTHSPQAFKVNDDGTVSQCTVEDWRHVILQSSGEHQTTAESTFIENRKAARAAAKSLHSGIQQPKQLPLTSTPDIDQIDNPSLYMALKLEQSLSFTENTNDWKEYLDIGHSKLSDWLKPNLLGTDDSLTFLPEKDTILGYNKGTRNVLGCLSEIENAHGKKQGMVIASKMWLSLIQDSSPSLPSPPQGHVIDLMSIDPECIINIWVVFDQDPGDASPNAYVRDIGRRLRLKLTTVIPARDVPSVSIQSKLFLSGVLCSPSHLDEVCSEYFKPDPEQIHFIHRGFGTLLLSKKSAIRNTLGDHCLITLTMHQASQVIGSDITKFTHVQGGPGTGKTILLLYISNHVFEKEKCIILCANPNLKAYFDYQNAPPSEIVINDEDMIAFLETDLFQSCYCLLIDDCQLLSLKMCTWFALFDEIETAEKCLFVFSDNEIQDYRESKKHVKCAEAVDHYQQARAGVRFRIIRLAEVHRNCQKVTSFLSKTAFTFTNSRPLKCVHDEVGDDVEVVKVERLRDKGPDNGMVKLIASLTDSRSLRSGQKAAYEAKHIAVLIDGNKTDSDVELFKKILKSGGYQTQGADRFPVTGIIVTTVRSFSGLDAKVILLVAPERFTPIDHSNIELGFHQENYKAFVASRGVYRVMFITEADLNPGVMRAMNMDKLSSVVMYRPDYHRAVPTHHWSVPVSDISSPSVAVCPVSGRVVLAHHENLYILTGRLEEPRTVTVGGGWLRGVAVSPKGAMYTTDCNRHTLLSLKIGAAAPRTLAGGEGTGWEGHGTGPGEFDQPRDVAVSPSGELYVVDSGNHRVQVLSTGGRYLRQLGSQDPSPGVFKHKPDYVAVSHRGTVAVSDDDGNIHLYTEGGAHTRTVTGDHHGLSTRGLSSDCRDNLLVAGGLRVAVLGPDMELMAAMDTDSQGGIEDTWDVAVSPDGSLLVVGLSLGPGGRSVVVERYDVPQQSGS